MERIWVEDIINLESLENLENLENLEKRNLEDVVRFYIFIKIKYKIL